MARQITLADVSSMPDDLRQQLLEALLSFYMPGGFKALLKAACDDAVAQFAALQAALPPPKPPRFRRGPRALRGDAPVPPALSPGADAIRSDSSGVSASAGGCIGDAPASPLLPPSNRVSNVVTLPGTRREDPFSQNCDNDRPALMTKARPPRRP
jgi:hypothetical protein